MAKIILMVIGFLLLVVVLGILTAWANHIELGRNPEDMSEQSLAKYIVLRFFLLPAEWVLRLIGKHL